MKSGSEGIARLVSMEEGGGGIGEVGRRVAEVAQNGRISTDDMSVYRAPKYPVDSKLFRCLSSRAGSIIISPHRRSVRLAHLLVVMRCLCVVGCDLSGRYSLSIFVFNRLVVAAGHLVRISTNQACNSWYGRQFSS